MKQKKQRQNSNSNSYKSNSIVDKWLVQHEQYRIQLQEYRNGGDSYTNTNTNSNIYSNDTKTSTGSSTGTSTSNAIEEDSLKSLLDEFAEASLLDLGVKDEAFRSREIFICMQNVIVKQLSESVQLLNVNIVSDHGSDNKSNSNTNTNTNTNPHSDYHDMQNKLRKIVVDRLLVIHGALKVSRVDTIIVVYSVYRGVYRAICSLYFVCSLLCLTVYQDTKIPI